MNESLGAATAARAKNCCPVLMNAHAGRLHRNPSIEQMQQVIDHLGVCAQVIGTRSPEHLMQIVREHVRAGAPRIAVAGGDGTVALAVQELAYTDTALGIIAQGTSNNFATALRLPMDLPSALRVLEQHEIREVDLGQACGRYFTESAGVGIFANALALYGASNKNLFRAAYATLKILLSWRASRVQLTMDGRRYENPAIFCAVANTYRIAQAMPIAPGAKITDGVLDVVLLGDLNRSELLQYLRAIRQQVHIMLPKVAMFQASEVTIESRHPMLVSVDDKVPCATPVTVRSRPKALKVMIEKL